MNHMVRYDTIIQYDNTIVIVILEVRHTNEVQLSNDLRYLFSSNNNNHKSCNSRSTILIPEVQ